MLLLDVYACTTCRKAIVTRVRDQGILMADIKCIATPDCPGRMYSAQEHGAMPGGVKARPNYEWHRVTDQQARGLELRIPGAIEHHKRGGLFLRQIGFPNHGQVLFQGEWMVCILCGRTQKSHPRIESDWTAIQLDDWHYYICPAELPHKRAGEAAYKKAYDRIFNELMGPAEARANEQQHPD
jgi:hypothetical protein